VAEDRVDGVDGDGVAVADGLAAGEDPTVTPPASPISPIAMISTIASAPRIVGR
jgi:hypothetical protein